MSWMSYVSGVPEMSENVRRHFVRGGTYVTAWTVIVKIDISSLVFSIVFSDLKGNFGQINLHFELVIHSFQAFQSFWSIFGEISVNIRLNPLFGAIFWEIISQMSNLPSILQYTGSKRSYSPYSFVFFVNEIYCLKVAQNMFEMFNLHFLSGIKRLLAVFQPKI